MFEPSLESSGTQGKREGNEQSRPLRSGGYRVLCDYLWCSGYTVRFFSDNFEVRILHKEYYTIN